jgi:hypothetical protein
VSNQLPELTTGVDWEDQIPSINHRVIAIRCRGVVIDAGGGQRAKRALSRAASDDMVAREPHAPRSTGARRGIHSPTLPPINPQRVIGYAASLISSAARVGAGLQCAANSATAVRVAPSCGSASTATTSDRTKADNIPPITMVRFAAQAAAEGWRNEEEVGFWMPLLNEAAAHWSPRLDSLGEVHDSAAARPRLREEAKRGIAPQRTVGRYRIFCSRSGFALVGRSH